MNHVQVDVTAKHVLQLFDETLTSLSGKNAAVDLGLCCAWNNVGLVSRPKNGRGCRVAEQSAKCPPHGRVGKLAQHRWPDSGTCEQLDHGTQWRWHVGGQRSHEVLDRLGGVRRQAPFSQTRDGPTQLQHGRVLAGHRAEHTDSRHSRGCDTEEESTDVK